MRAPARTQPLLRLQMEAMDAMIAAGALARGCPGREHRAARQILRGRPAPKAKPQTALELRLAPNGVQLLRVRGWENIDWLWHGFSTRSSGFSRAYGRDGSQPELNLGFTPEDGSDAVARNRQLLAEAVTGTSATPLITIRQIHSNLVLHAGAALAKREQPEMADGLITGEPGLLLAIRTADCIPVLVADRRRHVVAAFHAGWRGTVKRIVECGIGHLRLHFGSRPEDLVAAIGPGIGACCYAVGEEVQAAFESQFAYAHDLFTEVYDPDPFRLKYPMLFLNQRAPGHAPPMMSLHLDLVEANRRQLIHAGLRPGSIHSARACTCCHVDRFFSHRAEHGRTGRMMAVIGIGEGRIAGLTRTAA